MKGLLRKDWYMTVKYLWFLWAAAILFPAFMLLIYYRVDDGYILAFPVMVYPLMTGGLSAASILMNDEKEKCQGYVLTLPVTRAQYVAGKYLFGACSVALITVICAVLGLACHMELRSAAYFASGSLLLQAVLLPLMFWLGAMKGYIIFFSMLGGTFVAYLGYSIITDFGGIIEIIADGSPLPNPTLCLLAAVALYALSWGASVTLYRRREL